MITLLEPPQIKEIFRRFAEANPDPRSELQFRNPYTLLVSVVLSAQATDKSVNKATEPLYEAADTPQKMVDLGEEKLIAYIRSIGLYRTKAKNVMALSRMLIADFNGEVPRTREELMRLPGVGRKTANVVLNVVFGESAMAVDTHILRISPRIGLSTGVTPEAVEQDLLRVVPPEYLRHAHHWLILQGRYICTARNPKCDTCLISDICPKNGVAP